jgi:hypothetical protein
MKYTLLIFPIFSFFCTASMWYDKVEEPIIEDPLIAAIIQVESGGDTLAYNSKEDAVGCLQIRPIMVREVNRLVGKDSFTLYDRWSKVKVFRCLIYYAHILKKQANEKIARSMERRLYWTQKTRHYVNIGKK